ncbi:nitroreductase family deazaflavin-dependent oxidoreductase [Actinomadura macrotermitis]|uniref:nitroreductase family deazaflavin-dependent oxidoreductase n=1 Tax=Actinomadura macrotermitis TaxID=2585200 RepID=UPI001A9AC718|nr:nitroreductase family deazaflavin-dependent oxidoreductase [Actinomadura macrotermitis]
MEAVQVMKRLAVAVASAAARITSLLGPDAMRTIARFNKYVTNPVQRLWAPHLPYYAVIEHTGRKSGKGYRTPVMAFIEDGGIAVMLNYGTESDWVRNVQAAGTATVVHRGRRYHLTGPRIVSADSPDLPSAARTAGTGARSALHGTLSTAPPAES